MTDSFRIRNRNTFKEIYGGKRIENESFIIYSKRNNMDHSRISVVINKKFACAAKRNRTKRKIKEYFRLNAKRNKAFDYIVIPKRNTKIEINKLYEVFS